MRNAKLGGLVGAVLAALLITGCQAPKAAILMGPFATRVGQTDGRVMWVTDPNMPNATFTLTEPPKDARVRTATRPIGERGEGEGILHVAEITGLSPDSAVRYAISDPIGTTSGSFQTAQMPGTGKPMRFLVYGDTRTDANAHGAVARAMTAEGPVSFVLHNGDFAADGTIWPLWMKDYFTPSAGLLRQDALWTARGNHELDSILYREIFDPPGEQFWYSFDCGDLHVTVLDTGLEDNETPDPNQVAWLAKDLAASKAPWKVVLSHAPIFNIGGHMSRWGQKEVLPLLEKYGVDVVISGHSHLYERFAPIGEPGGKPILHVVCGGGGAPLYPSRPSPILEVTRSTFQYCLFELQGDKLVMTAKTPEGTVLDRFELIKKDGRYQPEIMRRTWSTQEAEDVSFILTGFTVGVGEQPQAGKLLMARMAPGPFPRGAEVKITSAAGDGNQWTIAPAQFRVGEGNVALQMIPPPGVRFGQRSFVPGMSANISVAYLGKTYTQDGVPVSLSNDTIKRFTPEPVPCDVPQAPAAFAIDGNLADWNAIPALAADPRGRARTVRLAWRAEGLYGAVAVEDANVNAHTRKIWDGDCLELFVEADYARTLNAVRNPNCFKVEIYPRPGQPGNQAGVHGSWGKVKADANAIRAAWQKTPTGYNLEFLIPASLLGPAPMENGKIMGFHYALRDDGKALDEFLRPRRNQTGFGQTPLYWGALRLVSKP
jgi:predicted phosphodiesterase